MSSSSPEESSPPSPPSPPANSSSSSPSPPNSSSTSSPPPPSSSSSSPPPASPPPPSTSPPPPSTSPPPPSNSPPPPSNSPPPSNNSPPPPSGNNTSPPSDDNDNNSPPTDDDNGGSSNKDNDNKSPPPPKSSGSSSDGNSFSPPPPPPQNSGSPGLPSPRDRSPSSSNSPSNDISSSNNQKDIIAGAAAGAGLLLLIMIVFLISCARRKKRSQRDNMYFYNNNSHGNKAGGYYDNRPAAHGNWKMNDRPLKPPPHGNPKMSPEQGWLGGPQPPQPMMSSSEMSSGFSGPHQAALPPPHPGVALGFNQSSFTYDDLAVATGNFSQSNLLGQGGFGYVHKGVLPNGKEIAVKSLKSNSSQGEREFQAEVDIISRVHHRHLVSLVGYCIAGSQRMLVYEYVPNGNLEYHLYGTGRPTMDWQTRHKIAMGSAKGFAYLHEDCHPRIIHRDIKAANILLDYNFEAKVADFGLAKLSSDNNTHVSTRIMGTFGYLAPEYASSGKLTEKSDVYSFGVMLLELITGRRPVDMSSDDDSLVDWARPILIQTVEGGSFAELVDPRLENNYDPQAMLGMVAAAAACIRHSARRRPKMSQIVRALEGDASLEDLNHGIKTGHNAMFGSSGGPELNDIGSYSDLKRYRNAGAVSSQEFTSSDEHSNGNGEFVYPRESPHYRP